MPKHSTERWFSLLNHLLRNDCQIRRHWLRPHRTGSIRLRPWKISCVLSGSSLWHRRADVGETCCCSFFSRIPCRGIFSFCGVCFHGGHIDHIRSWFKTHDECPFGCGHRCKDRESVSRRSRGVSQRHISRWSFVFQQYSRSTSASRVSLFARCFIFLIQALNNGFFVHRLYFLFFSFNEKSVSARKEKKNKNSTNHNIHSNQCSSVQSNRISFSDTLF